MLLFGAYLVILAFLVKAVGFDSLSLTTGAINVYPYDVAFGTLMLLYLINLFRRFSVARFEVIWLIFGAVVVLAFMRGLSAYDLQLAGDVRRNFYIVAAVLFFSSYPVTRDDLNRIATVWMACAFVLSLVALGFWAMGHHPTAEVGLRSRILGSYVALFIMQGALISMFLWIEPGRANWYWKYLSVIAIPVVVLLQTRTVWVVFVVSLVLFGIRERRVRGRLMLVASGAVIIGSILLLVFLGGEFDTLIKSTEVSVAEPLTSHSTFLWRVQGWEQVVSAHLKLGIDMLVGPPAGALRTESKNFWFIAHTHNEYLNTFLQAGVIGLFTILITYYFAIRGLGLIRENDEGGILPPRVLTILLLGQMLFGLTYDIADEQYILLGMTLAYLFRPVPVIASREHEPTAFPEAHPG